MTRFLSFITALILTAYLSASCLAIGDYSRYIRIENGKSEIAMTVGGKQRLHVSSAIIGVPLYKNLRFNSRNPFIVSVDRSGIVRANMCGSTYITVTDEKGRTDSIRITVTGGGKAGLWGIIILLTIISALFFLRNKK